MDSSEVKRGLVTVVSAHVAQLERPERDNPTYNLWEYAARISAFDT
jgi:hypothetical protein